MNNPQDPNKQITEESAKQLIGLLKRTPIITAAKSFEITKKPLSTIRQSQILAGLVATLGLIIFALGIENLIVQIPELSSPTVEIILGLLLLSISGLYFKKLM